MSRSGSEFALSRLLGETALPYPIDPEKPALLWRDQQRTYRELRRRSLCLAAGLVARGVRRGDRVAWMSGNRGDLFELYFACAYGGFTFVPVGFRSSAQELAHVLASAEPRLLFCEQSLAEVADEGARASGTSLVLLGDDDAGPGYEAMLEDRPLVGPFPVTDPHCYLFTSGTTGVPKGISLRHDALYVFGVEMALYVYRGDRDTVNLMSGPWYHLAGMTDILSTTLVGGTLAVMDSGGWSPQRMSDAVDRWHATFTVVFPSMMRPLLEADRERTIEFASLRAVTTYGENLPPEVERRFRARWTHVNVIEGYGLTEGGDLTLMDPPEMDAKPGSIGRQLPWASARVVDPDGNEVPQGDQGELYLTTPARASEYLAAPEESAAVFRGDWVATGDLARVDEDGYIYLVGRVKDLIISGASNIYPAEVESVLAEHPDVLDVAVVGVPDSHYGEAVCAVLVPKDGRTLDEEAVIEFVRVRIGSYKKPRYVVSVDQIPRNPTGKALKRDLARQFANLESERTNDSSSPTNEGALDG